MAEGLGGEYGGGLPTDPLGLSEDGEPEGRPLTDSGNAERLIAKFGGEFRWWHENSGWLTWDGRRWVIDRTGGAPVARMALQTVREARIGAARIPDKEVRERVRKWCYRTEDSAGITAMMSRAKSMLPVPVVSSDLDRDPWLLAAPNGTIDLTTGNLREHRRGDLITKMSPVDYRPDAKCERFKRFLSETLPNSADMANYFQKVFGYMLTGDTRVPMMVFCYGTGDNGKSILTELLQYILGTYSLTVPSEALMVQQGQRIAAEVADMLGMRLVCAPESAEGSRLDEAKIKWLTGGDTISAQRKFGHPFQFKPTHKLILSGNHKPTIAGVDHGIWKRVHLWPFLNQFPPGSPLRDDELDAKLRAESSGILAWMVEGCLKFRAEGIKRPADIEDAVAEYRQEMDYLGEFLTECVDHDTFDDERQLPARHLFQEFERWCKVTGRKGMTETAFGRKLGERPGISTKKTNTGKVYLGMALRNVPPAAPYYWSAGVE